MERCKICGSYAINEHSHGRELGKDLDLCDVCYWRNIAETYKMQIEYAMLKERKNDSV